MNTRKINANPRFDVIVRSHAPIAAHLVLPVKIPATSQKVDPGLIESSICKSSDSQTRLKAKLIIELISESQVSRLEKRLRSLEAGFANSHTAAEPPTTSPRLERSTSELEIRASPSAGENQLFEGGSSFSFQSVQASKAVEMTAKSNDPRDESTIKESLDHLQSLLRELPSRYHHSFGNSALRSMPAVKLLPVTLVIGILQRFKSMHLSK